MDKNCKISTFLKKTYTFFQKFPENEINDLCKFVFKTTIHH